MNGTVSAYIVTGFYIFGIFVLISKSCCLLSMNIFRNRLLQCLMPIPPIQRRLTQHGMMKEPFGGVRESIALDLRHPRYKKQGACYEPVHF